MLTVATEGDKVMLGLGGRRYDLLLAPDQAEALAEGLLKAAATAEVQTPQLVRGEPWGAKVASLRNLVAVRLFPPGVGAVDRVPLPARAARQLAGELRAKADEARAQLRLRLYLRR